MVSTALHWVYSPKVFGANFAAIVDTFIQNGGRIKFDLTGLEKGLAGWVQAVIRYDAQRQRRREWRSGTIETLLHPYEGDGRGLRQPNFFRSWVSFIKFRLWFGFGCWCAHGRRSFHE